MGRFLWVSFLFINFGYHLVNLVSVVVLIMVKEERTQRLQEIEVNRAERQNKRRIQRQLQTQNFYKSLHMLQAATFLRDHESESTSTPFEDYSLFLYRQNAPEFLGRVKELEQKLLYPVSEREERRGLLSLMVCSNVL